MKKILLIIKKLCFGITLLYGFNIIMNQLNILIPINIYTILTTSILGFPGLFTLVGLFFVI